MKTSFAKIDKGILMTSFSGPGTRDWRSRAKWRRKRTPCCPLKFGPIRQFSRRRWRPQPVGGPTWGPSAGQRRPGLILRLLHQHNRLFRWACCLRAEHRDCGEGGPHTGGREALAPWRASSERRGTSRRGAAAGPVSDREPGRWEPEDWGRRSVGALVESLVRRRALSGPEGLSRNKLVSRMLSAGCSWLHCVRRSGVELKNDLSGQKVGHVLHLWGISKCTVVFGSFPHNK